MAVDSGEITRLIDDLSPLAGDPRMVDWIALDKILSGMRPEQAAPALRELLRRQAPPGYNTILWSSLLQYAAAVDPKGVLEFAMEQGRYEDLSAVVELCFVRIPEEVLAAILKYESKPSVKEQEGHAWNVENLLNSAFHGICDRQPDQALVIAGRNGILNRKPSPGWMADAMKSWVSRDAGSAMRFSDPYPELQVTGFHVWVKNDRSAALAWLNETPERADALFGKSEYSRAPDEFPGDELSYPPELRIPNQAAEMVEKPTSEALEWVNSLPPNARRFALPEILNILANRNPADAVLLCQQFPEVVKTEAADAFVRNWSRKDPAAASQFLQTPEMPPAMRDHLLSVTVSSWLKFDRETALEFIGNQTNGELQGFLLMEASRITMDGDQESIRDFVMSMPDLATRTGAARRFLEPEFKDAGAAPPKLPVEWINTLPDAELRKILLTPKPVPPPEPTTTEDEYPPGSDPFSSQAPDTNTGEGSDPFGK